MTPPIFTPEITNRGLERVRYTDAGECPAMIEQMPFRPLNVWISSAELDRDRVATIVSILSHWLETGSLMIEPDATVGRADE